LENEKSNLTTNLRDAQQTLDKSQNDLQNFMAKVTLLAAHVDSLHHLRKQIETEDQLKGLSSSVCCFDDDYLEIFICRH